MAHRQRRRAALEPRHRRQRHLRAAGGADIDAVQQRRIGLQLRIDLQHHLVLVALGVDRRDLPLRIGIVQRVVDRHGADAEPRRGVAVDHHVHLRAGAVLVGGRRRRCPGVAFSLSSSADRPVAQLAPGPGVIMRELVLRAALPAAAAQILRREQEGLHAADLLQRLAQPGDHLFGRDAALGQRLQADREPAAVHRAPAARRRRPWSRRSPPPGSASSTSTTARWRSSIAWNETSGEASVEPIRMPVSCSGRKPFGTHGVEPHGQHDGRQRHQQHEHAMRAAPSPACARRSAARRAKPRSSARSIARPRSRVARRRAGRAACSGRRSSASASATPARKSRSPWSASWRIRGTAGPGCRP